LLVWGEELELGVGRLQSVGGVKKFIFIFSDVFWDGFGRVVG
jgi:hypothetical protein